MSASVAVQRQKFTLVPVLQEVIVKMCYADGCSFAHEAVNAGTRASAGSRYGGPLCFARAKRSARTLSLQQLQL